MALNYTTLQIQIAQVLRISRKRYAYWLHAQKAATSNSDPALLVATNGYSTTANDEQFAYEAAIADLEGDADSYGARWNQWRDSIRRQLQAILANDLEIWSDTERNANLIDYEYTITNGTVAIAHRRGVFGALRKQMTTDAHYVTANGITFGTFTAANGNVGTTPTVTGMTGESHALTGTLIFECTDENVGAPKLTVRNRVTNRLPVADPALAGGTDAYDESTDYYDVLGDNPLQMEKQWEDGPTGLTITLTRPGLAAPTEANDTHNVFSSSSISTPSETDSNKGKIYVKVSREASDTWRIQWYKDSALSSLVQQQTTTGTSGTFSVDMTGAGGMRFQSTFSKTNAHAGMPSVGNSDDDITFDIGSPRLGDKWYRAVTNDEAGLYSTKLAYLCHASLPTSGSTLWTDSQASSISVS